MGCPLVSVVMTTYDSERHVREAAESILAQDLADLELIVVDDGSTDRTLAILEGIADPRLRILRIPRCGRIPSLNHGFRAARAAYVANQDADDVSLPHRLRAEVEALQRNPGWAMVGAAEVPLIDEAGRPLGTRTRPTDPGHLRRALAYSMPFFHSSCLYRKSAWEEAGGFDESLALLEDYDLWVRLAARHDVANLPGALGRKRRHAGQAFDGMHWTNQGYRTRARILRRYFRFVRRDPRVLLRAAAYQVMTPGLRVAWMRATRRDPTELEVRKALRR
ncbi:MAG TPA: glycosyltransferase [Candidatus Thermoplasmatota archaeon]|nr:glycosyltransferase [Candidatus Thermoplasmatota archaeon]